jgi:hypothetical protein
VTSSLLGRVVEGTPEDFAHPGDDYLATRAKMAPLHGHPLAGDTRFHTEEIRGIRVGRLSRPSSDPSRGTVLYRLAPEHRFPAALEDGMAAYRALLDEGWPPDRLLLLGDSCGGGLALSTVIAARDGGRPLPAGVVALSGWVDLDTAGYAPGRPARRDPFITEGFLRPATTSARRGIHMIPAPRRPGPPWPDCRPSSFRSVRTTSAGPMPSGWPAGLSWPVWTPGSTWWRAGSTASRAW